MQETELRVHFQGKISASLVALVQSFLMSNFNVQSVLLMKLDTEMTESGLYKLFVYWTV